MATGATELLMTLGIVTLAASSVASALPRLADADDTIFLVMAPPWAGGASAVVASAGGSQIGPETAMFAVAAYDVDVSALRAAGAWAVFSMSNTPYLCGGGAAS